VTADKKSRKDEAILNQVARAIGTAAGTVVSKAADALGATPTSSTPDASAKAKKLSSGRPSTKTTPSGKKSSPLPQVKRAKKRAKTAKHKRKLGRRTSG